MWRVLVALIVAVLVGYLGLEFMTWLFKGTLGVIGTLTGLLVTALVFWLLYRFLADKVEDHKLAKAHKDEVEEAYRRGLADGLAQAHVGSGSAN